ncbi:hypothetical protein FJ938_28420 [Mesorhizobium sp. B2-4-14]|nr:hypothetical protein FJ938_28420 [Mesorhizobium sp. B2-4-14]
MDLEEQAGRQGQELRASPSAVAGIFRTKLVDQARDLGDIKPKTAPRGAVRLLTNPVDFRRGFVLRVD